MSMNTSLHLNDKSTRITTKIRKVWDNESFSKPSAVMSFEIKSNDGDDVCLFVTLAQLEQLSLAIDTFIASAVDPLPPTPTGSDMLKSQVETEQGWSLA